MSNRKKCLLIIAGNDPSGGAGLAADIETASRFGVQPLPVVSSLTVQDSVNVVRVEAVAADLLQQQLEIIAADLPIDGVKIGLLGSVAAAEIVAAWLKSYRKVPVVLDPVLRAGGGAELTSQPLEAALRRLLSLVTLTTPNSPECRRLAACDSLTEAAERLLQFGAPAVLVTGSHEAGEQITHRLYTASGSQHWSCQRLHGEYHGSGCTLATAIAAQLAQGVGLPEAIEIAHHFTYSALQQGVPFGRGQLHPNRTAAKIP